MDSFDSAGFPSGSSRLLSQSPQFPLASPTGPGGDDLSLSELYPDNRLPETQTRHNQRTRPSIAEALGFVAPPLDRSDDQSMLGALEEEDKEDEESAEAEADVTIRGSGEGADRTNIAAQLREEKLQSDLFVLRQLNGAFAVYNDALRQAQKGTERIAEQLEQTDALLNKYVNILSETEHITRLVFDEQWKGAEADETQLEEEERMREEGRRREEEERQRAAQRERERREKEESERAMRDEVARLERERRDRVGARSISGVRGVRGTRASMRASAAVARGGSRAVAISSTAVGGQTKVPGPPKIARPSSAVSSARGTTSIPRGISKRP